MRLTICVWALCSRGRSCTEQSPDGAKENEWKIKRDKPSQADRRAFRAYSHRCSSRFHSGKLDNRLAKSSLSPPVFNDKDEANVQSLQNAISELPGIATLKYPPEIMNNEVGTEIVEHFESIRMVPTLFFVDPFGYKGLSLRLVNAVLKNWGSDCIFFFNYNRINMGVGNDAVLQHMEALFGPAIIPILRPKLAGLSAADRELVVVEAISRALVEMGGKFVLPFRFRDARGSRTSHYLIFVSKHVLGYTIMKGIMATESSSHIQGVPTFEFSPATKAQPLLFELTRPLDDLAPMLLACFAGRTMTTKEIFDEHHVGRRYILPNYKAVLSSLEEAQKVRCEPVAANRPMKKGKRSFADGVRVTFPANN
jgi:three-Cys-motif partner protein